MKTWSFKLKDNPKAMAIKLENELNAIGGFVFNKRYTKNTSVAFTIRKRMLYIWYWAFQNWTVVSGEIVKNETENGSTINITFNQHYFIRLLVFTHLIVFICFLISSITGTFKDNSMYIISIILLLIGLVLWIAIQRKFKKDTLKYKSLISQIFDI